MPQTNKTIILVALIAATPPTIAAVASLIVALNVQNKIEKTDANVEVVAEKIEEVHIATNSMKDTLVASTRKQSLAEGERAGMTKGIAVEKARTIAAKENQAKGAAAQKAQPFWKK